MKNRSMMAGMAIAAALLVVLLIPTVAMADSVAASSVPTATTTTSTPAPVHPSWRLVRKFRILARARMAVFNANARVLGRRLNRLAAITSLAEKAGGDVTNVRGEIRTARDDLAQARGLAAIAFGKLRLVPFSAHRKAALANANAAWKAAHAELRAARVAKQTAAHDLWALVKKLNMTSKVSVSAFK